MARAEPEQPGMEKAQVVQVAQVVDGRVTAPAVYSVVEAAHREAAAVPGLGEPGAVRVSRRTAGAAEAVCSAAGPAAVRRAAVPVEMVPVEKVENSGNLSNGNGAE